MALIASYVGKNEVLNAFEKRAKVPYFSIWDGTRIIVQYNDDDFEEAKEIISDEFDIKCKRNYTNICVLKLHSEKEKVYTAKSLTTANLYFSWLDTIQPQPINVSTGADMNAFYINEINNLRAEINALKLKEDNEEEEDEEEEDKNGLGQIGDILNHPLATQLVGWLTSNINNGQRVNNLAGVEEQTAQQYVQMLFNKGVTIEHLRKLAEMPQAKIKILLTML